MCKVGVFSTWGVILIVRTSPSGRTIQRYHQSSKSEQLEVQGLILSELESFGLVLCLETFVRLPQQGLLGSLDSPSSGCVSVMGIINLLRSRHLDRNKESRSSQHEK